MSEATATVETTEQVGLTPSEVPEVKDSPDVKTGEEVTPVTDKKEEETPEQKAQKQEEGKKNKADRRWDKLVHDLGYQKAVNKQMAEQLEQLMNQSKSPAQQAKEQVPQRANYDSDEAYVEALTDFKVDKKLGAIKQQETAVKQQQILREYNAKIEAAKTDYDDMDEKLEEASDHPFFNSNQFPYVTEAVLESEHAADLTYYLAANRDEADKIAAMTPNAAVRYLGRIETYFEKALDKEGKESPEKGETKPVVKASKAPPPYVTPKGTGGTSGKKPIQELKGKEFAEAFLKL